jgi:hypothetical protein
MCGCEVYSDRDEKTSGGLLTLFSMFKFHTSGTLADLAELADIGILRCAPRGYGGPTKRPRMACLMVMALTIALRWGFQGPVIGAAGRPRFERDGVVFYRPSARRVLL